MTINRQDSIYKHQSFTLIVHVEMHFCHHMIKINFNSFCFQSKRWVSTRSMDTRAPQVHPVALVVTMNTNICQNMNANVWRSWRNRWKRYLSIFQ